MKNKTLRNFIKNVAASTAALVIGSDVLAVNNSRFSADSVRNQEDADDHGNSKRYSSSLDLLLFEFFPNAEKEMITDLIRLRRRYGFRRFLITGPQ